MLFNNIDDGYLEGLLRGMRAGILTSSDYANLCQCETIDGEHSRARAPSSVAVAGSGGRPLAWLSPHAAQVSRESSLRTVVSREFSSADMKMHLASTDYGNFLQNEPSPISTTTLATKLTVRAAQIGTTRW